MIREPKYIESSAAFDDSGRYRYLLVRRWAPGPHVLWCMLNSSKANAIKPDPTVTRCLGFTWTWGAPKSDARDPDPSSFLVPPELGPYEDPARQCPNFGGFEVVNMYAYVSPYPEELWKQADPVGPNNDAAIQSAAKRASLVVVAWGGNAKTAREREVAALLRDVGVTPYCLGTTTRGSPLHPFYIRGDTKLQPWALAGGPLASI